MEFTSLELTLSRELSSGSIQAIQSTQRSEITIRPSDDVANTTRRIQESISKVLVPFGQIHGISQTISPNNPLCAASVRFNAKIFFGLNLPSSKNAETLRTILKDSIEKGKQVGKIIPPSLVSSIAEYSSFLIFSKSTKRPKDGHVAKGFKRLDGKVYVLDTELRVHEGKKSGTPIEYGEYLDELKKMNRPIVDIIAVPSEYIAI